MRDRQLYLLNQPKTEEVINELILLNKGLLNKQLYKFYLLNDPDALSFAYEALYKAIITFKPESNNQFSTYATVCMYNRLGSYVRSLHKQELEVVYYEESVLADGSTLQDVIDNGFRTDAPTLIFDGIVEALIVVDDLILTMRNPLQRCVATEWRESNFTATHETIAANIGCTQSYVSQIIKKLVAKAKHKLGELENV
jgi:RNA polymerase sigma factor (sigma-70 family)